jgi:hypothetical protein
MSRIDRSTHELFLRLGSTPRTRSTRADKLFRQLRADEQKELTEALQKAPARLEAPQRGSAQKAKRNLRKKSASE